MPDKPANTDSSSPRVEARRLLEDKLNTLVGHWRHEKDKRFERADIAAREAPESAWRHRESARAEIFSYCANELEAVLRALLAEGEPTEEEKAEGLRDVQPKP